MQSTLSTIVMLIGGGKTREREQRGSRTPTDNAIAVQILGFQSWMETKGLHPGRRYSFAKTAEANKIMFTKAMNATVT